MTNNDLEATGSPMDGASHYETLGVSPKARPAAIEKAWRKKTASEGPGSARLSELNSAAEVLLDPIHRAGYDAELAAMTAANDAVDATVGAESGPVRGTTGLLRLVALVLLPVLALGAAALAVVLTVQSQDRDAADRAGTEAQAVVERAMPVVLAYDYRKLEEDRDRATDYLTPGFGKEFDRSYDLLVKDKEGNPGAALQTKTVVTAKMVGSAVMDAQSGKVSVLAFVNQTSVHADGAPRTFANRVRVVLTKQGDKWLISDLDPR